MGMSMYGYEWIWVCMGSGLMGMDREQYGYNLSGIGSRLSAIRSGSA